MNPFPIIGARIHPPLLRADTLTRDRLNAWLDEAATGRVALVVAEAGFGKTTLLGDWARNSQRLTAWYRLDPDDRDWLTFCRHLVASGRELDPEFAHVTYGLLLRLGPGGPTRADIEASLVREYAEFGASRPQGLTLIFDDYHVVDGSDEVVPIVRALIDRTGPGFNIVIAARSTPQLPLGRLRARGAVSRIGGEALCFDVPETDRLFRDAYRMPIDPDVVDELVQRTEGWAALLSLVNVTLGEQSHRDARTLVAQLSATDGDLYDYLAEEVVVGLDPSLHSFLKKVSVLRSIDVTTACLITGDDALSVSESIAKAEGIGLLAKPDRESAHRFHPLVRAFLLVQLVADIGDRRLSEMHAKLGMSLEPTDWASSAWHYRAAGDPDAGARVVDGAIEEIFAAGQFERARPFLDGSAGSRDRPEALILRSRLELTRGNHEQASALAHQAIALTAETALASQALLNASSIDAFGGIEDLSAQYAQEALRAGQTKSQQSIARATIAMWQAGRDGRLDLIAEGLRDLVAEQDLAGHLRYAGISRLNLSGVLLWLGEVGDAASVAARAQVDLGGLASGSAEYAAAVAAEAKAIARLGHLDRAEALIAAVLDLPSKLGRDEACAEWAEIKVDFGDVESAASLLDLGARSRHVAQYANLVGGGLALRRGDVSAAASFARDLALAPCTDTAGLMRGQILRTRAAAAAGNSDAGRELEALQQLAVDQRSRPGAITADLLRMVIRDESIHSEVVRLHPDETYVLSQLAEEMSRSLHKLSPDAGDAVRAEALRRPARWATALRLCVQAPGAATQPAIRLLSEVGSEADVTLLRTMSLREKAIRPHAAALTRRLAPRVEIADLGTVELWIDGALVTRRLRRKVLGLLCFVSSRPGMASTRDEALEALWPDLTPSTAVNSLHQTIYFLRRLFEPEYKEGIGAGYLQFDGEVLSFDSALVRSASRHCWELIASWEGGIRGALDDLLHLYRGKFALDFSYEDWASGYRDNLHAAVLGVVEREIARLLATGDADGAARRAQSMLLVDPAADAIELQLLTAYKRAGRHAAAAEQYAHYSATVRNDLGAEPPDFSDI